MSQGEPFTHDDLRTQRRPPQGQVRLRAPALDRLKARLLARGAGKALAPAEQGRRRREAFSGTQHRKAVRKRLRSLMVHLITLDF